ncbi:NAD(P)-dependent oxidoreductase [Halobacillus kuroshimensis]|uniref:NAD(P)-dependent oxidoreductase n=1 Tax=Halobacillus kuroshimensis TaxID=302481 RepID=UPI000403D7A2|nr:NAD(P)-dependent oxidoreductase [Halobacillus kuroshimensis]
MKKRVGVIGTGLIGTGLVKLLSRQEDLCVSGILTRRSIAEMGGYPREELLTNSREELIDGADIIVECSGDVLYGSEVIEQAMNASLPVVTMNAELQVTTGSYFAAKGVFTEAEGDQPGCLAKLDEDVRQMGFKPVVYGNIKGFLNQNPSEEDMLYWSKKNGTSLGMTTSFTDGTKVHIEQVLVGNGLGADISDDGILGLKADDSRIGGQDLAEIGDKEGRVLSDYILSGSLQPGVFITARHEENQQDALRYYKMGDGPYYTMQTNYHLCHLEVLKTIRRVINGGGILLNNSTNPRLSVAAIAKKNLLNGTNIEHGIGSFEFRGEAVRINDEPDHVPIGLLRNGVLNRSIEEGEMIRFSDVELPDSFALRVWKKILNEQVACVTK